jgi:putative hydrolase of the HAD superfamily
MKWIEATFPFIEKLTYRFYSCTIGSTKVDTEFYAYVCKKTNVKPNEILFFDDDPLNVNAAKDFGITAYYYTDLNSMQSVLKEYNLIT